MDKHMLVHSQGDNCEDALLELKKRIEAAESELKEVEDADKDKPTFDDGEIFSAEEQTKQIFDNQGNFDEFLIKNQNKYLSKLFGD